MLHRHGGYNIVGNTMEDITRPRGRVHTPVHAPVRACRARARAGASMRPPGRLHAPGRVRWGLYGFVYNA